MKILRKKFSTTVIASLVFVVVAAFPWTPAQASIASCPSGALCLWSGSNYTGSMQVFTTTSSYRTVFLGYALSLYNHRTKRSNIYQGSGGTGVWACFSAGEKQNPTRGWVTLARSVYLSTGQYC